MKTRQRFLPGSYIMKFTTHLLAQLVIAAAILSIAQPASAQTFKKVSVKGGAKMVQVAAGGASVWALATNGNPYFYKVNKFVLANTISLTQIAVGGGNLRQADTVWGLDSSGRVYNAVKSGTSYVFNPAPGILSLIAVGIGYEDNCHPYEVWGLNPSAEIYRFSYCLGNWELIGGTLATLSVGGGDVYGLNGNFSSYQFNFKTLNFELFDTLSLNQISAGPNGVWGVDSVGQPIEYRFHDLFLHLSQNTGFSQVQGGGDGVWALDSGGRIYLFRRAAYNLVQVPGFVFASMSVGSGGGVWGIDPSGQLYAFSTQ